VDDLEDAVAFAIFTAHTGDVSPAGLIGDARAHFVRRPRLLMIRSLRLAQISK
jgi:hypothetical protein